MTPTALLYDPEAKQWLQFNSPLQVFTSHSLADLRGLLVKIEEEVERNSLHAIGFVSYEASRAFEAKAETLPADDFPLLWFGLFSEPQQVAAPIADNAPSRLDWQPAMDASEFQDSVVRIKAAIAAGETYQVNLTFPLTSAYSDDPWPLFCHMVNNQPNSYSTWLDTGRFVLCSASPELFFQLRGNRLVSKPMKGTATRGMTLADDRRRADTLQDSIKERAENTMVLDMIRNDLARLADGPVEVEELCAIEKHPTVWQMTSTAATVTDAPLVEIITALFPCASITGAPKLKTMQHIVALESSPRRIYTGTIGHIAPKRQSRFSVAIRTALIDREAQTASYGVGAGITWESDATAEYRECLAKAQILKESRPPFSLLETILWEPDSGYFLFNEHLQRLQSSAIYFNYEFDRKSVAEKLELLTRCLPANPYKVRLLLDQSGEFNVELSALELSDTNGPVRLRLAGKPVSVKDPFLYHKTTNRKVYETARQSVDDCDEVLLFNDKGEVTEACHFNIVARVNGELVTPPISCGLLAGTLRDHLLKTGEIREQIIHVDDLPRCEELYLINSVRRWRLAELLK